MSKQEVCEGKANPPCSVGKKRIFCRESIVEQSSADDILER
jgi:hypothetical protein